jgi:hypothetical protein
MQRRNESPDGKRASLRPVPTLRSVATRLQLRLLLSSSQLVAIFSDASFISISAGCVLLVTAFYLAVRSMSDQPLS